MSVLKFSKYIITAILNSVRKAFERAQQLHGTSSNTSPGEISSKSAPSTLKRKSILKEKKKDISNEEDESPHWIFCAMRN
jgi:hypothetical protein